MGQQLCASGARRSERADRYRSNLRALEGPHLWKRHPKRPCFYLGPPPFDIEDNRINREETRLSTVAMKRPPVSPLTPFDPLGELKSPIEPKKTPFLGFLKSYCFFAWASATGFVEGAAGFGPAVSVAPAGLRAAILGFGAQKSGSAAIASLET